MCEMSRLDIIVSTTNDDVNCNVYHGKTTIKKVGYLHASIATAKDPIILTIEGKWLEGVVHMSESNFLFYHVQNRFSSLSKPNYVANSFFLLLLNLWVLRNTLKKCFLNPNHLLV
jgi:hypothetical protein